MIQLTSHFYFQTLGKKPEISKLSYQVQSTLRTVQNGSFFLCSFELFSSLTRAVLWLKLWKSFPLLLFIVQLVWYAKSSYLLRNHVQASRRWDDIGVKKKVKWNEKWISESLTFHIHIFISIFIKIYQKHHQLMIASKSFCRLLLIKLLSCNNKLNDYLTIFSFAASNTLPPP